MFFLLHYARPFIIIYVRAIVKITRVRGRVKFTSVNKMEAMYERLRVNVKVERGSTFNIYNVHATFQTLPLFYLRT